MARHETLRTVAGKPRNTSDKTRHAEIKRAARKRKPKGKPVGALILDFSKDYPTPNWELYLRDLLFSERNDHKSGGLLLAIGEDRITLETWAKSGSRDERRIALLMPNRVSDKNCAWFWSNTVGTLAAVFPAARYLFAGPGLLVIDPLEARYKNQVFIFGHMPIDGQQVNVPAACNPVEYNGLEALVPDGAVTTVTDDFGDFALRLYAFTRRTDAVAGKPMLAVYSTLHAGEWERHLRALRCFREVAFGYGFYDAFSKGGAFSA